jgi:hypothetical protein
MTQRLPAGTTMVLETVSFGPATQFISTDCWNACEELLTATETGLLEEFPTSTVAPDAKPTVGVLATFTFHAPLWVAATVPETVVEPVTGTGTGLTMFTASRLAKICVVKLQATALRC